MKKQRERMRDGILRRGKNRWAIVVNLGFKTDPVTGIKKQKQQWVSFEGSFEQAKTRRDELRDSVKKNTFVRPTKVTVRDYAKGWLENDIRPPKRSGNTYRSYKRLLDHACSIIGDTELQQLDVSDLKALYAKLTADGRGRVSVLVLHDVIHAMLATAVAEKKVTHNIADVRGVRPSKGRRVSAAEDVLRRTWTVEEARKAVTAAKTLGSQTAALIALALNSGMRLGELLGLKWPDIDLERATVTVVRQLLNPDTDADPGIAADDPVHWERAMFGPTKGGGSRVIDISDEVVTLLRDHKRQQNALKMRNRKVYADLGLVFAREPGDREDALGRPLRKSYINAREFARVIKAAGVRRVVFHGLRHTAASLMLLNGEPVNVVQRRLGHGSAQITMGIYAHVLPGQGKGAAERLGKLLHG